MKINIRKTTGAVFMEISDNGRLFDVDKAFTERNRTRLGLIGMREHIEMVGGILTIHSKVGSGATACAEIPFSEKKNQR